MARSPKHIALSILLAAGCSTRIFGALEEELEQKVVEENGGLAGTGGNNNNNNNNPPPEPEVELNSIQPSRGRTAGGDSVEIIGVGFEPDMLVYFGDQQADPAFVTIDEFSIHCITPPMAMAGRVTVYVGNTDAVGFEQDGFEYFDDVHVIAVDPARGPAEGGITLTITGSGFVEGSTVQFGTGSAVPASVIDGNALVVIAPALARNRWAVTVRNINGSETLPAGYTTYDPVRLRGVVPAAGPIAGGTDLLLLGTGFVPGSAFTLAGLDLAGTTNAGETELHTTSPSYGVEGPVDAHVTNENGEWTLPNAFVYYDATNDLPRVIAVTPDTSLIEGGREVTVVVGGMADDDIQVYFGGAEGDCTVATDLHRVTCIVPEGAEGPADVRVVNGTIDETLAGGFNYIDLRIDEVLPPSGAIAGNSWVRISGSGYGADTRVYFDGREASIVSITEPLITLRTPARQQPGLVDVRVETQGLALTAEDAFTYFDPFSSSEWTSGGPIEGSVNVTVIDDAGEPVEAAMVIVGNNYDPARPHLSGFTNTRGQITISGAEVFGPQSVHAGKTKCIPDTCDDRGNGNFSWVSINAQNLTMMLFSMPEPPPDPLPECPTGEGAPPPMVRGRVYRIKDEFNTGNDYVVVTTTYPDLNAFLPDPGPKNQMVSQGPYEIAVRTGDLSMLALAGSVTAEGTLDPHAIGFHPFLTIEPSSGVECQTNDDCPFEGEECIDFGMAMLCQRFYNDVDIVIDTPLNQPMGVVLEDPPLGIPSWQFAAAPNQATAITWYDLGNMGVFAMTTYPLFAGLMGLPPPQPLVLPADQGGDFTMYFDMPKLLPLSIASAVFNVYGSVDGESPIGDTSWSESYAVGLSDTSQPVVLTPYLRVNHELTPWLGAVTNPRLPTNFWFETLPATSAPNATAHLHYMYDVLGVPVCIGPFGPVVIPTPFIYWFAIGGGTTTSFTLPHFPEAADAANFPHPSLIIWQSLSTYVPDADINNTSLDTLFMYNSDSGRVTAFCHEDCPQ
jgi:hypothetical protein